MSSALVLIVLGQAYSNGTSHIDTSTGELSRILIPNIDQPLEQNVPRRSDYTYTPGIGSHKFHNEVTTWNKAVKICRQEGGHLAVINSLAEANVIAEMFAKAGPNDKSYSPNYAWIGTHDLINLQGDFQTIHGESLVQAGYNEWHETRSFGSPTCGAVFKDGELSWFSCHRTIAFFCELPSVRPAAGDVGQEAVWWIRKTLKEKLANPIFVTGSAENS